ncbi:MAG: 50S ribosomal protein L6 [Desulfobulbaceae bacterium]|jgi:large subunit ribosomal protein L6|nr:50S ribosomal protein L6 [Desulfobulbaceae bacterium]
MSRIGNKIIEVPDSVKVAMKGNFITVTGPKGSLERTFLPEIEFVADGNNISVKCRDNSKRTRAFSGLCRTLLDNMIIGTTEGFQKKLLIEGVGYRAELKGNTINLNVGFSNPVHFELPAGITATVEKTAITLDSIDKELLGQTAAQIRGIKKPEPYKGKGIRYSDEHIVRKAGKTASK